MRLLTKCVFSVEDKSICLICPTLDLVWSQSHILEFSVVCSLQNLEFFNLQRSFYDYTSDYDYDYDYDYEYDTEETFKSRRKSKAPQDYDYEYDYDYALEEDFCFNCAANVNLFDMDSLQNKSEFSLTFPFLRQSLTFTFLPHKTHLTHN